MKNFAEFQIVGRVGKIKGFDNLTRVSIAANYRNQDDKGNWIDNPHWNEVVIFRKVLRDYIHENVKQGNLVFTRGRLRQDKFKDINGEQCFTTNLIVSDFMRLI